jgi:protein-disulfide isomerase
VALQNPEAFWIFTSLVFSRQNDIKPENAAKLLLQLAKDAGVDPAAVQTCIRDKVTEGNVRKDIFEAQNMGFNGTPTYLINGRFITGTDPSVLKSAVDEALAKSH